MLKRQSTTAKLTNWMKRLIKRFCRMTGNGVMCRCHGEEIAVTEAISHFPEGMCIYKKTLEQISRILGEFSTFVRNVHAKTVLSYEKNHTFFVDGEEWDGTYCGVGIYCGQFSSDQFTVISSYGGKNDDDICVLKSGEAYIVW